MPEDPAEPFSAPDLKLADLLFAISNPLRWQILRELAGGDQLMVTELAERTGQSADVTGKHLAVLRKTGIVSQSRNRLYQLDPRFIADQTNRVIDLGWCVLRTSIQRPNNN